MNIFTRRGLLGKVAATIRNHSSDKVRHKRPFTARPSIEVLEDRLAPATITVNTTLDALGVDSLREAISSIKAGTDANVAITANRAGAYGTADSINFSVTGTINLTGELPGLGGNLQIQGPGTANLMVRRDTGGDYRIFYVAGSVYLIALAVLAVHYAAYVVHYLTIGSRQTAAGPTPMLVFSPAKFVITWFFLCGLAGVAAANPGGKA